MQYAFGSVALAGALLLVLCVPAKRAAESALWFATYHTKVLPILCVLPAFAMMGFAVPLVIYVR